MSTKSRERIYGSSIRASAERARETRRIADQAAAKAWNDRILGYQGPAQPSRVAQSGALTRGATHRNMVRPKAAARPAKMIAVPMFHIRIITVASMM